MLICKVQNVSVQTACDDVEATSHVDDQHSPAVSTFKILVSKILQELNNDNSQTSSDSKMYEKEELNQQNVDPILKPQNLLIKEDKPNTQQSANTDEEKILTPPQPLKVPSETSSTNESRYVPSSRKSVQDYRSEFLPEDSNFFVPLPDQTLPHAYRGLPVLKSSREKLQISSKLFPEDTSMVQSLADIVDSLEFEHLREEVQTETDLLLHDFSQWRLGNLGKCANNIFITM